MADESVDAKSQTTLNTVYLTLQYCCPIILDTFFVYFGQIVLFFFFLFSSSSSVIIIFIIIIIIVIRDFKIQRRDGHENVA